MKISDIDQEKYALRYAWVRGDIDSEADNRDVYMFDMRGEQYEECGERIDGEELDAYIDALLSNGELKTDDKKDVPTGSLLPLNSLDILKFNADCAISSPGSIYADEFFLTLDEVFGEQGKYSELIQAKAISRLIEEIFKLRGYKP